MVKQQPLESTLQTAICTFLRKRKWTVKATHGNAFQSGFPDLFAFNKPYGFRWIDVKRPVGYRLTRAQIVTWPEWEAVDLGVWIMTAATEEEYLKLFGPPNFRQYWSKSYDKHLRSLDSILDEITMDVEE